MPQGANIQTAFIAGEISPALWGRVDHPKYKFGASTVRNGFINFQGGYSSRAGTAYVGMSKQTLINRTIPPRLIPFQFSVTQGYELEFGDLYMRVIFRGAYVTETAKSVTNILQADPGIITSAAHGFSNDDWVFAADIEGMTEFNGLTWIVQNATTDTFTLEDLFGNAVDTTLFTAYTGGGTFARIYTVASPYAAVDLDYLKYTQSADQMSLTCWNQITLTEYPPYDLTRSGNASWAFTQTDFGEKIAAPTNIAATAQHSTTLDTWYSYVVTAIDAKTNSESIASAVAYVHNNDISVNAGSNTITWSPVAGAANYNVYGAAPYYSTASTETLQIGVPYGFLGNALGNSFTDKNVTADFTRTPPLHTNPFARGIIADVTITGNGSGYSQATIGYTITTSTGSGFSGVPIVVGAALNGFYIIDPGENYAPGDTIDITGGSGGTATLVIGPESGTYPGTVAYFQQRRVYAGTEDNPDTYYATRPGDYTNMDSSIPSEPDDAIIGTPWAQQVNGVQFMTPMPGGLVMFTGNGAWQLSGGSSTAITPADQSVQPQTRYGCSATIPPIPINFHILYVRENDGIVYDLLYNFWVNMYTGTDLTLYSSHLFEGYTLKKWAYAEKPYKLVHAVRDDGTLLSLTYIAEQEEQAWSRHDTNGLFIGVSSIEEPPVDATYVIVQRFVNNQWVYYIERFDNRLWITVEDCFCVDAGLVYPMSNPAATLAASSAEGSSNITDTVPVDGGRDYTAPVATAVDSTGAGTGATFSITMTGGILTAVTPDDPGQNYTPGATSIIITDPTGTGAEFIPLITNDVTFTASASVFTLSSVGSIIRMGNGSAQVVRYISGTQVVANLTQPITAVVPNDPNFTVIPAVAGSWSISMPTTVVSGLNHLEGLTVTGLADGGVINPTVVENGQITLPVAASQITVGLPFIAQLQALYLEIQAPATVQTRRKNIPSVGVRVHNTRGVSTGSNQPDASTQPGNVNVPWNNMIPVKELNQAVIMGNPIPLKTGDYFQNIGPKWDRKGQVAFQQMYPLPMNIDAFVTYHDIGDTPSPT